MAGLLFTSGFSSLQGMNSNSNASDAKKPRTGTLSELPVDTEVSTDDDAVWGSADAPVTIVEFSDYQCYYCQMFHATTFPKILENYIETGKVRFVYRDYTPEKHPQSSIAAQAAECAGTGGDEAYYKMHEALFSRASEWSGVDHPAEAMVAIGNELGYDISACLDQSAMAEEVNADYTAARGYAVSGTPTFFINGHRLVGAWPYEYDPNLNLQVETAFYFKDLIDEAIKATK